MRKLLFLILIAVPAFFISCGDDESTGPSKPSTENLLPETVGSWWVYATYELDTLNNRTSDDPVYDSTVVAGMESMAGKLATIYSSITLPYDPLDLIVSQYYSYDRTNNRIYMFSGMIYDFIPLELPFQLPKDLTENWLLVADTEGTEWTAFEHRYENDTISIETLGSAILNGDLKVVVTNEGSEMLETSEGKINTWKFKINLAIFNSTVKSDAWGDLEIPITLDRDMYVNFASNIGLIRMKMDLLESSIPGLEIPKFPGYERILERWRVLVNAVD